MDLPERLRQAMRHWTTGVTVVTSQAGGVCFGMTVNSFTSVSLEPPVVAVALANDTRTRALVEESGVFGVTILRSDQQEISDRFAGRTLQDEERFVGLETVQLETGSPFLVGGLAFIDCRVIGQFLLGHSTLYLGAVAAVRLEADGEPLVYHNRDYRRLAR
jgi:flavin reductase (DIM6/NTAB) family NADH-FMN oxidoreductase RutF